MFLDIKEGIMNGDFSILTIQEFFETTSEIFFRDCKTCNINPDDPLEISRVALAAQQWAKKIKKKNNRKNAETDIREISIKATEDILKKLHLISNKTVSQIEKSEYKMFFQCLPSWTFSDQTEKCFKYNVNKTSWKDASKACQNELTKPAANLVSVPDQTTNDFILTLTTKNVWIGGYRDDSENWAWSDGSKWTGYANWFNESTMNTDNFLMFNFWGHDGMWNSAENNAFQGSLCHYDPKPCEPGWTYSEHTDLCYKQVLAKTKWKDSMHVCKSESSTPSANLASIPDQLTNNFLSVLTKGESSWTGASRTPNGNWTWSDNREWTGFTNWGPGEPIINEQTTEIYMLLNWPGFNPAKWKGMNEDHKAYVLCQYDLSKDKLNTLTSASPSVTVSSSTTPITATPIDSTEGILSNILIFYS